MAHVTEELREGRTTHLAVVEIDDDGAAVLDHQSAVVDSILVAANGDASADVHRHSVRELGHPVEPEPGQLTAHDVDPEAWHENFRLAVDHAQ